MKKYKDSAWNIAPGNIQANHRYSPPGLGALYTSTSEGALMGEMNHYGVDLSKTAVVERNVTVDNVLDLTGSSVQESLGVTASELTSDNYSVTQSVGSCASSKYNAILVPSASVPSRRDYWVESFEFDPRIRRGELPVDALTSGIALLCPGPGLVP